MKGAIYTSNPPNITENITKSYSQEYGDDILHNPRFKYFELCYGPLYMTPLDLFKWVEYVSQKYRRGGKGIPVFFQETTIDGQGPLGVIEKDEGKVEVHIHGGYAYSFEALIFKDYEEDLTIIMMTNDNTSNDLDRLRDRILGTID